MQVKDGVLSTRRGFFGLSVVLALAAFLALTLACGGSSGGSTDSGGGGGGGGGTDTGNGTLTVSPTSAKPGQVLTIRGNKLPKGGTDAIVRGELLAVTPTGELSLLNVNVLNQTFSATTTVPDELTPGDYVVTLKFKGEHAGKEVSSKLTVLAP